MNIVNSQLCRILYFINTSRTSFGFAVVTDNSTQDSDVKSACALTWPKPEDCLLYAHTCGTGSTVGMVSIISKIQQNEKA